MLGGHPHSHLASKPPFVRRLTPALALTQAELTAVIPVLYSSLLEHALVRAGTSELFAIALHALLEAGSHAVSYELPGSR